MKKLKYLSLVILSMFLLTSCFDNEPLERDLNGQGNSVAGFTTTGVALAAIADGTEYTFDLIVKVTGPGLMDLTSDVVMTVGANEASTAIEGTHYRLDAPSVTLTKANNYLGKFTVTMLTAGIEAPLATSPVVVLEAVSATGAENVAGSGKNIAVTLNYACPSELAGDYSEVIIYTAYDGTVTTYAPRSISIAKTGVGEYRTTHVGHWGILGVGTEGFTFTDVCDVLTIPTQNLVDYYSNIVAGTEKGSVEDDGTLLMKYSVCVPTGCRYYDATYTPAK